MDFSNIKAFAFDVDGVLTDGGIYAVNGDLLRCFDAKDSFALRMASMAGYTLGIITGGQSETITQRMVHCGVPEENVYLLCREKIEQFRDFCEKNALEASQVMYFGDDLPDIPVMEACGIAVCPSDAADEVKEVADIVSAYPGGHGCVRKAIEEVMKAHGKWHLDVKLYKEVYK